MRSKYLGTYLVFFKLAELRYWTCYRSRYWILIVAFGKKTLGKITCQVFKERNGVHAVWRVLHYACAADVDVSAPVILIGEENFKGVHNRFVLGLF